MSDWYADAREADGRTDEEVMAEIRTRQCPGHDPNSGPGSDWCPNCRQYAAPSGRRHRPVCANDGEPWPCGEIVRLTDAGIITGVPAAPALMVNFGPDFTPEQVQTAREQIESLMRPADCFSGRRCGHSPGDCGPHPLGHGICCYVARCPHIEPRP